MNIKDWNRNEIKPNEVFHFKNSLRPFISVENTRGDFMFIDINEMKMYSYDELEYKGLDFYRDEKEEDLDFQGVEIDGKINWVN